MFVKKFEAPSLEQALARVKNELGPNALILSTQNKRGKWFQRSQVEVTAAFEKRVKAELDQRFDEDELRNVFPHRKGMSELEARLRAAKARRPTETEANKAPERSKARSERSAARESSESRPVTNPAQIELKRFETGFSTLGFGAESSRELARRLVFDYSKSDLAAPDFLTRTKAKLVAGQLRTLSPEIFHSKSCWAAIGLPGVGKTSLLVKLALFLKGRAMEAQLISLDGRKVIGRSEMAAYAKLMKLPFTHENNVAGAVSGALQLVDTPALCHHSEEDATEMERYVRNRNVLLVLDATSRYSELMRTVEASLRYTPTAVAFTKLDVVQEPGVIYDVLKASRLPLLGLSLGRSLKKSFQFFEAYGLANFILNQLSQPDEKSSPKLV